MPSSDPPPAGTRRNIAAYVAPFIVYALLTMVESGGWLGLSYEAVYTLKTLLVAGTLWVSRRRYPSFSTAGSGLALVAGAVGCVVWILLAELQGAIPGLQLLLDAVFQGSRAGYDPWTASGT